MQQTTNSILMVRPVSFKKNLETAINNYFQADLEEENRIINEKAQQEFDDFVSKLKFKGVNVIVVEDTIEPETPDSIFPNNWVSFHESGDVALYPMFAKNRRLERREDVLELLEGKGF